MDQIILPGMRSHVPGVAEVTPKPTWHLPIHVYTESGINLDFGPLLLFDRAIIDEHSMEFVRNSRRPELRPMAESLSILQAEGYLATRDLGSDLRAVRSIVDKHVDRIVGSPLPLRAPVLRGINGYRGHLTSIGKFPSECDERLSSTGFGLHLVMAKRHGGFDEKTRVYFDNLMTVEKKRWTRQELDDVREIVRATVTYLYQNMALSEICQAPFLDADYTQEMYGLLYTESVKAFDTERREKMAKVREGQQLFNCVIPHLRPASPKEMLKFLKQSFVKDFRQFVSEAVASGQPISKDQYSDLLANMVRLEKRTAKLKQRVAWGERVLSLVPGCSLIATGAGVILEKVVVGKESKKYKWLCALIDSAAERK
jgi:hypothetical protein